MRDLLFGTVMLSMPAAAAVILGHSMFPAGAGDGSGDATERAALDRRADDAAVFAANCAGCHGAAAIGTLRAPGIVPPVAPPLGEAALRGAMEGSLSAHDPVPSLSAQERDAIIRFLGLHGATGRTG